MVPGPYYSAKVGDVLVKRDSLNQTSTWKITKVDDTTITIETSGVAAGGRKVPGQTFTKPRMVPKDSPFIEQLTGVAAEDVKDVGKETLTISGQKLVCQVKQTSRVQSDNTTLVRKFWTSPDVPGRVVKVQTTSPKVDYVNQLVEFTWGEVKIVEKSWNLVRLIHWPHPRLANCTIHEHPDSIEVALCIPGTWSGPEEIHDRLPECHRLKGNTLFLPDKPRSTSAPRRPTTSSPRSFAPPAGSRRRRTSWRPSMATPSTSS